MYIAVCDDCADDLEYMIQILNDYKEQRNIELRYKIFSSAMDLLQAAEEECFSIYLLDIMMSGLDGIAVAHEIRSFDETAEVVFFTSSTEFAYASYGVHAMDYLLKPVKAEKIFAVLDRIMFRKKEAQEALLLKCGATLIRVPYAQISHVEVMNKRLSYYLTDGTVKEVYGTLRECEMQLLAREEFKKIHRSYIVNLLQVKELAPACVKTITGSMLPVSRGTYPELQRCFLKILFSGGETT